MANRWGIVSSLVHPVAFVGRVDHGADVDCYNWFREVLGVEAVDTEIIHI